MQALRQLGVGVIIAIVSVILVLGGIFLALAENLPAAATPTLIPPTFPFSFPTPTATIVATLSSETPTATVIPSETASGLPTLTSVSPTVCSVPSGGSGSRSVPAIQSIRWHNAIKPARRI